MNLTAPRGLLTADTLTILETTGYPVWDAGPPTGGDGKILQPDPAYLIVYPLDMTPHQTQPLTTRAVYWDISMQVTVVADSRAACEHAQEQAAVVLAGETGTDGGFTVPWPTSHETDYVMIDRNIDVLTGVPEQNGWFNGHVRVTFTVCPASSPPSGS